MTSCHCCQILNLVKWKLNEFSIAYLCCPDCRVDLTCSRELVSWPETHTRLKVPSMWCRSALKAVYFCGLSCLRPLCVWREEFGKAEKYSVGRNGFICSGSGTEEMVKVFTELFTKELVIAGAINMRDKGTRTQPSVLKEQLRESFDKTVISTQLDLMNFIWRGT